MVRFLIFITFLISVIFISCSPAEYVDNQIEESSDMDSSTVQQSEKEQIDRQQDGSDEDESSPGGSDEPANDIDIDDDKDGNLSNWDMYLAVDDQFDVYFGTPMSTTGEVVGRGTDWTKEYHYRAEGRLSTDHLYVVTTSDRDGAQGFIGIFTNTTAEKSAVTGSSIWEVFPAGAYETTNKYWPEEWPMSKLPSQEDVDRAIAYATENDLWELPTSLSEFDNNPETDPEEVWPWNPWEHIYPNIPKESLWIWYDSGKIEDGRIPGVFRGGNHDEFLIFRISGKVHLGDN